MIVLGHQQKTIMESQLRLNNLTGEILDILKGTLLTPGVLQRVSEVEKGLTSARLDICEHIDKHELLEEVRRKDEADRKREAMDDARDQKKRVWGIQDTLVLAVLLMALTPFVSTILKLFGVNP